MEGTHRLDNVLPGKGYAFSSLCGKERISAFVERLDPQYDLPSSRYFSNTAIPGLFEKTRENVFANLQSPEYFSATVDMWSSVTSEPYLCFTLHYIGKEWNLQSKRLQCLFLPEDHKADNLAEALKETLTEWQLDENKLICITTDSGSNMVCAASSQLMWTRLSCFGDNLHLAVVNSTKDDTRVHRALGLCRKIVTSFSHIWKKKRDLAKVQSDLD